MSAPTRLRCAIYTRKSTEEGLEQGFNSLHAQREACEAYCLSQAGEGWVALPTIYDDGGFSGGSMERPALKQLLADMERQAIDVVVVYKVDRLTRSLSDFARIVEVFDKRNVSFVSVTQAFNTTTSMGRLTLNVLLSFAQFEREVTGERIRDKIAASKAKGMWMGGNPPLGYDIPTDPQSRALVINDAEAETIRLIFQRYLDLGSVRALAADLRERGVVTKQWIAGSGRAMGGTAWREGPLYHLLKNRIYRGDIDHKGVVHVGRHKPIISVQMFEAVQARLNAKAVARGVSSTALKAVLTGKVFDDRGHPMSPVTARRGERSYRYYVSQAVIRGDRGEAGSIQRVPALTLEACVERERARWLACHAQRGASAEVEKVIVREGSLELTLLQEGADGSTRDTKRVSARLSSRGGAKQLVGEDGASLEPVEPDQALLHAIARGRRWEQQLVSGVRSSVEDIATAEGVASRYVDRVLQLAWLSPQLAEAILDGAKLRDVRLSELLLQAMPLRWQSQAQALRLTL